MIAMLVIIGQATTFRYFQSALLPYIFGGFVFLLCGVQLWRELTGREKPKAKKEEPAPEPAGEQPAAAKGSSFGMLTFWLGGFALAILLLGHLIAIPLFTLSYVRWRGRSWPISMAFAAGMTALLYGIFTMAMRVYLYPGLIMDAITGRLFY